MRSLELDIMKFYGILLVVIGHVFLLYTDESMIPVSQKTNFLIYSKHWIYSFHMPLFTFVSGCVLCYQIVILHKRKTFLQLMCNKTKRLLIPYFSVAFLFLFPFIVLAGYERDISYYIVDGILLCRNARHLWFVWMLFDVFFLFHIIQYIVEKTHLPDYSLLIISFLMLLCANKVPNYLQLSESFKYIFFFTFGYVFILYGQKTKRHNDNIITAVTERFLFPISLITLYSVYRYPEVAIKLYFFKTLIAVSGIVFFYELSVITRGITKWSFFQAVSRNSFGIYLFHMIIIYFYYHLFHDFKINPYLLAVGAFFASLFGALACSIICRQIGLRFIIGELK